MSHGEAGSNTCCPKFEPALWDEKTHVWDNKLFIKDSMWTIWHIPLPWMIKRTIGRMWQSVQKADAAPDLQDFLLLSFDPSPWRSEYYMTVTREIPGAEHVRLSGTFFSRVFDGPYHFVPKWMEEMQSYAASQGKTIKKQYFYYTTCPKCAKIYGHNYVVGFAQID